ncbi:MAG TPA: alkaline phosphatase family protein, partial [Candidatus Sulfotelmatobacter sp.]
SSPAGINCPGTCSASFAANTAVTLTAAAASNYLFGGWTGGCTGASKCSINLTANASVTANFNPELTVSISGGGTGTTVTSSPAGINCPTTCTAGFAQGSQVTLTASSGASLSFSGWSGSCSGATCTVTMSAPETATASFATGIPLTVSLAGAGSGTVTSTPAGITCSPTTLTTCTAAFAPNAQVTLAESPVTTNTFAGWSGGCTGTGACTVTVTGASAVTATFGGSLQTNINHIILFAQENRSFDHYFGYMRKYWANHGITDQPFDGLPQFNPPFTTPAPTVPGCNLDPTTDASDCSPDSTNPIQSFSFHSLLLPSGRVGTVCQENQSPFWNEAHNDWSIGNPADEQPLNAPAELNGFVWTAAYDARGYGFMDVNGVRAMGYYEDTDLNYYYDMATKFGTSDKWFSPLMDRTQVNRMYMIAATSHGDAYPIGPQNGSHQLPSKTIFEALQDAGLTWKIYVNPGPAPNYTCDPNAVSDANAQCLIQTSYINMFTYQQTILNSAGQSPDFLLNIVPIAQFKKDADAGTLPDFAMIEPASTAGLDEHPSDSDGYPVDVQQGALYAENTIINPLMQSASWTDSALIFTFDEAGGFYDHVPPQPAAPPGDFDSPTDLQPSIGDICTKPGESLGQGTCTFGWTGYRVPVIVISPYSVKNFVSHTQRDTTAVLKMVESRFGLGQLTNRDGTQADMDEFFDFVTKPWATPPATVTQSTSGHCDQTPAASWHEPPVLTVAVSGSGTVSSSPTGIDSCSNTGGRCSSAYPAGTVVTLTPTAGGGYSFSGWSGACTGNIPTCTVTVNSSTAVTATFTLGP